jgi:hypothetical protein
MHTDHVDHPFNDSTCQELMINANSSYSMKYLIEALLSRGAVVKDQLLATEQYRNTFIAYVCAKYRENKMVYEHV